MKKKTSTKWNVYYVTAEFVVEFIRQWWQNIGKGLYPTNKGLLIFADGRASNGTRNKLRKMQLQQLATQTSLTITDRHLPPATSKWNKIEHRLFSYISINWRGKPFTSFETVIELISHTTTKQGLPITAVKDINSYLTGLKVSDEDLATLNITREPFHGDWNYTIQKEELVLFLSECSKTRSIIQTATLIPVLNTWDSIDCRRLFSYFQGKEF